MSKNVCETLLDILADVGVRQIFGMTGDALNPFLDAIRRILSCPSQKTHPDPTPDSVPTTHVDQPVSLPWFGHIDSPHRLGAVSGLESRIEYRPPCPG